MDTLTYANLKYILFLLVCIIYDIYIYHSFIVIIYDNLYIYKYIYIYIYMCVCMCVIIKHLFMIVIYLIIIRIMVPCNT